jgi:hypothetical protein
MALSPHWSLKYLTSVDQGQKASNVDKNLGAAFIVVPITLMAAMLNKRVMLMICVEPTLGVMVISQSATRTDGDEEDDQNGSYEVFLDGFHILK